VISSIQAFAISINWRGSEALRASAASMVNEHEHRWHTEQDWDDHGDDRGNGSLRLRGVIRSREFQIPGSYNPDRPEALERSILWGLARVYVLQGDSVEAWRSYQDFLTLLEGRRQVNELNLRLASANVKRLRGLAVSTVLHIRLLVIANSKNGESCIFLVVSRPFYLRKE